MNPLVASERFRHFGPDFDGFVIEIQRQMASGSRKSGRSNKGPYLAARGGHELRKLICRDAAANHGGGERLRIRQLDLIVHTLFWLTSHVPPVTVPCSDSPPGKRWNYPKQIQPGQIAKKQPWMMEKQVMLKMENCGSVVGLQRMSDAANCEVMRDGYAAVRRIPGNGASSKHLPAERQC